MKKIKYKVIYDDGQTTASLELDRPDVLPQPGEVYEAVRSFHTVGGLTYHRGDKFKILRRTNRSPHNRRSSLGNLVIECKYHTSVWTAFESAIAGNWIQFVS
jgi:hypothetical protein